MKLVSVTAPVGITLSYGRTLPAVAEPCIIGTVDSALFMFAPEIRIDKIAPKSLPALHLAGRGEMTLMALSLLRDAKEPI